MYKRITSNLTLVILALLLTTHAAFAQATAAAAAAAASDYAALLKEELAREDGDRKSDEVGRAIRVITAGSVSVDPSDIAARLKSNYPVFTKGAPIRLHPFMRETLITRGDEYERLVRATARLFEFAGVTGKVFPVLYKSEQPVVANSYPNAVIFSTRALSLLSDDEIEAMAAHELGHLVGHDSFKRAVDDRDNRSLRVIELFYDAGAIAMLQATGKDPRKLISGLYKLQEVLEREFDERDQKGQDHPTMSTRERMMKALLKQFSPSSARR